MGEDCLGGPGCNLQHHKDVTLGGIGNKTSGLREKCNPNFFLLSGKHLSMFVHNRKDQSIGGSSKSATQMEKMEGIRNRSLFCFFSRNSKEVRNKVGGRVIEEPGNSR